MDFRNAPKSKRVIDQTVPRNPAIVKWLSQLPTSQGRLSEEEMAMVSDGGWSIEDLYLTRAMKNPVGQNMVRKDYDHKMAKDDDLLKFFEAYRRNSPLKRK